MSGWSQFGDVTHDPGVTLSSHIDFWPIYHHRNESGFRPPLCTYRLNWARRTSWGWWDDWDDTVLQTQDSKFEPWRSEAEYATSRSQRLPTILTFTRGCGRNNFVSFKPPRPGTEPRNLAWKAAVLTTTLGPPPSTTIELIKTSRPLSPPHTETRYIIVLWPMCRYHRRKVFGGAATLSLLTLCYHRTVTTTAGLPRKPGVA